MNPQPRLAVRRARRGDLPAISKLLEELLLGEVTVNKRSKILHRSLRDKRYDILVAVSDRSVVGVVDLWTFPDPGEGAELSTIQNMVVARKCRGRGIANPLVEGAIELARKRGAKEIHVSTMPRNARAIALYRKHGFSNQSLLLEKSPV